MTDSGALSENLARLRKARSLSQEELAEAAGVGVDTVGRIERGERATVRPTTVDKLARALAVAPATLRTTASSSGPALGMGVDALRRALCATGDVPGLLDMVEDEDVPPMSELVASGRKAWQSYVAGRTSDLQAELPALLTDARRAAHATHGDPNAEAHGVLATAYRLGAGLAGRLGLDDLAWSSAERALTAARHSAAIAAGRYEQSRQYLTYARSAAALFGADHAGEMAIFGRRVTGLYAVEVAVRTGEPASAVRLAERLPPGDGAVPRFWEAGHRLHLAKAAMNLKRTREALLRLSQARDLAPTWSAEQPLGWSVMRALVERSSRRRDDTFAVLAGHYGADR